MKYGMIDQLRNQHPIDKLYALLDVAKRCYPAWSTGKIVLTRKLEDLRLLVAIKAVHQRRRGNYGPKMIRDGLAEQSIVVV